MGTTAPAATPAATSYRIGGAKITFDPSKPITIDQANHQLNGLGDVFKIEKAGYHAAGFAEKAGAAAVGGLIPAIPASLAAWKSWTADAKLNKADAALRHTAGKLAEGVKIPGWLKGTAIATLLVASAGFISGMGQRAAKRVV